MMPIPMIPAGGRLDRNGWNPGLGESADDGIYSRLADQLVEAGFAVFRYDKPGAGRSSRGHYATERSTAISRIVAQGLRRTRRSG